MAKADDEMLEAIQGLSDAGANVNATKPVKPIRAVRNGKRVAPTEYNPNSGEVSFVEEDSLKADDGPFTTPPEPELTLDDMLKALDDCGVGYSPEDDEPNIAGENPIDVPTLEDNEVVVTKAMLIRKFAAETKSIYRTSPDTPQEKTFATQSVWNYVIALNGCRVEVKSIAEQPRSEMGVMRIERDVYCHAVLLNDKTGEVVNKTTMCASTDEDFVSKQKNKLSVAYGLAQTRAEERLARMAFGYQVSLAGLQPTPAEELDVVAEWWGTKSKEL